jgi:hypothetical protein
LRCGILEGEVAMERPTLAARGGMCLLRVREIK